ncbi:hypothetical protein C8R46DRAFT_1197518 [Mycena filopes]|nr:hypothetical protein C8R46DRAFT_1197518 [Mycena filopes]
MASDSSAASSPMLLTPDSTGFTEAPPSSSTSTSTTAAKKARRQTAFYPNVNSTNKPQKPFSRSAAKRESVMALGSIEHLQHYFTKTGIEAKKNAKAGKVHHGLVPVFGGLTHLRTESTESNPMELPPSPMAPQPAMPAFPPYVKTFEMDPESLLPGVIDDLSDVAFAWRIDQPSPPPTATQSQSQPQGLTAGRLAVAGAAHAHGQHPDALDVLSVLKTTTRAIRSVRNYLLSLPDESAGTIRAQFRSRSSGGSNFRPTLPSSLSSSASISDLRGAAAKGKASISDLRGAAVKGKLDAAAAKDALLKAGEEKELKEKDPLTLIRRAALEVLTVLRAMEERCRLPLSDDAYDAQSDGGGSTRGGGPGGGGGHSRVASPSGVSSGLSDELEPSEPSDDHDHEHERGRDGDASVAFSLVQVNGRFESVPVWEDEDEQGAWGDEDEDEGKKREGWDERLVLGSGWLYRQDVRLGDLGAERKVVEGYLDVVDEVLFAGKKGGGAGHNADVEGGSKGERGWERERRKALEKEGRGSVRSRSRANKRRGSSVEADRQGGGVGPTVLTPGDKAKRRVSVGMFDMMSSFKISEEPGEMGEIGEEGEGEEGLDGAGAEGSEDGIDDEELPEWARRKAFVGDELGRAHALLAAVLPPALLPALVPPGPPSSSPSLSSSHGRTAFLTALSSGQLLCVAYNTCVRRSKKPWGYISRDGIHDIVKLEEEAAVLAAAAAADEGAEGSGGKGEGKEGKGESKVQAAGWTFRRIDNLRLWAGALKIRYLLPIVAPPSTSTSNPGNSRTGTPLNSPAPAQGRFNPGEPPVVFDAKAVARRDEGWEEVLEGAVGRWVGCVVRERRGEV